MFRYTHFTVVLEREKFESRQVVPYMELAAFND